jgi:DNA-binding response OmpR family regulator
MADARTILLVDDDRDILGNLQSVLEAKGYRVLTAPDGDAGLAVANSTPLDLIVVDMMMPKKSGFQVIDSLKSRGPAAPKVIMMTANPGVRHRAYAELLGADDYLRKPFGIEQFLASVERLCAPAAAKPD